MAIKFGDILQNQNAAYPIVDGSNNDIKGVIFSTGLPAAEDFPNKRALGTILVDTAADKMYFYKGDDLNNATWSNTANWSEMAQGSGETIHTADIPVSIGVGNSFGRYVNGQTIDVGNGKTAVQIILDALTAYVAPVAAFTGNDTEVNYDTVSQDISSTVAFTVTNNNQQVVAGNTTSAAYAIREVKLWRKLSGGSYTEVANATASVNDFSTNNFAALNTAGSVAAQSFSFTETVTVDSGSNDFIYKVEVIPNDGAGSITTSFDIEGTDEGSGFIDCAPYVAPTAASIGIALQDTSSHFNTSGTGSNTTETSTRREKGNIATKITFTLDNNSSLVPITAYSLRRSINGATPVEIKAESGLSIVGTTDGARSIFDSVTTGAYNVTGLDTTVNGFVDVTSAYPTASINADTVQYSITITDDEGTTSASNVGAEINFEFPGMIGYGTTDASAFTASNNGTMTTLLEAIRDTSGLRAQYEILSTADNLSGVDANFGVVPLSPSDTQFVYIGYPAALDAIDTVLDPNNVASYGSFGSAPKSTTVPFTTHYGVQGTYEFYGSNSVGAYSGNFTIN